MIIGCTYELRHTAAVLPSSDATSRMANATLRFASVGERGLPPASGRIEMADLKERIRKLEAIAAGIDI